MRKRAREEAVVEGSPALAVLDEDRELVADLIAELLVAELEREADPAR